MLNLNIFLSAILKCLYFHITVGTRNDIPPTLALDDAIKCKHIHITNASLSQILWIITKEEKEIHKGSQNTENNVI